MSRVRRQRSGYSLLEVLVVIAILIGLLAVIAPVLGSLLSLEQRGAARTLALTYERFHDEAILTNATFRIAYHLDANYYELEVGDAESLIFDDPEKRAEFEEEREAKLKRHGDDPEFAADIAAEESRFSKVAARFKSRVDLPRGTVFGGVYTPQYEEMVRPSGEEPDPEEPLIVYSYLFANGFAEPTVVQIVDARDPEEGFTVIVEPLTGRIRLEGDVIDVDDAFDDYPDRGPDLPN